MTSIYGSMIDVTIDGSISQLIQRCTNGSIDQSIVTSSIIDPPMMPV